MNSADPFALGIDEIGACVASGQRTATDDVDEPTLADHRAAMTWAQRLKRL